MIKYNKDNAGKWSRAIIEHYLELSFKLINLTKSWKKLAIIFWINGFQGYARYFYNLIEKAA